MIRQALGLLAILAVSPAVAQPAGPGPAPACPTMQLFTPVVAFSISAGTSVFANTGAWCQIGQMVFGRMTIIVTSIGTASGYVTITGMPVAPAQSVAPLSTAYLYGTTGLTSFPAIITSGTTILSPGGGGVTQANIPSGSSITVDFSYPVS